MLYRTNVLLSGKLFRIKTCLWLNLIYVNMLCTSSQLVYSLQPLKVFPSSAYHLGMPHKRWAMLLFMPLWSSHTWVRITWIFSRRVYILVCTVPARHVNCIRLQSAWVEPSLAAVIKNYFGPSSDQPLLTELTFYWRQQHSKFYLMINFRLNQRSLPCRMKRSSLAVKREHDDISLASADWMRTYLLSIFVNWNELRHRKLSLICISKLLE